MPPHHLQPLPAHLTRLPGACVKQCGLPFLVRMGACSPRETTSLYVERRLASCPPNPLLVSSPLLSVIICTEVTLAVQQQQHYPWPAGVTAGPGRLASCPSLRGLFATVLATAKADEYWGMRQQIEVCAQNCSISLHPTKDRHFVSDLRSLLCT